MINELHRAWHRRFGHPHRSHWSHRSWRHDWFTDDREDATIEALEEHQRDLEQHVADVAARIRRLRLPEQPAGTPSDA